MRENKKSKLERLAWRIVPLDIDIDNIGKYLSYCSFQYHPGVIGKEKAKKCYDKGCIYYRKYRQDGPWKKVN